MATLAGQTRLAATRYDREVPTLTALLDRLEERAEERARIDLVKLTLDRLALSVLRAMAVGEPATVEVPDPETARLLRQVLAETAENRPTDRLVSIVVAEA